MSLEDEARKFQLKKQVGCNVNKGEDAVAMKLTAALTKIKNALVAHSLGKAPLNTRLLLQAATEGLA